MKRIFIVLIAFLFINNSYSQTNLDFETWGPGPFSANDPTDWGTFNTDAFFGPVSTFQNTATPGEAISSAQMVTTAGYSAVLPPSWPDTLGGIVSLGGSFFTGATGVAYTDRPMSVDFLFRSNIAVGDTGIFFVQLTHWDGFNTILDGQGAVFFTSPAVTNWTTFNLPITYFTSLIPDTLQIIGISSQGLLLGSPLPIPGTELELDSLVINTVDVGVISLDAPQSGCGLTAAESITITVENFGIATVTAIPVGYSMNGGPAVLDTMFTTLSPGATASFTFATTQDLSVVGAYTFDSWTSDTVDIDNNNDSLLGEIVNNMAVISAFPYLEDFEAEPLCGTFCADPCNLIGAWTNPGGDDIDWTIDEDATGSLNTGPAVDHTTGLTTGNFIYTEASGTCFPSATGRLESPCFDVSALTNPILAFWYHMYGANMGNLYVQVDSGAGYITVDSIVGQQQTADTDPWQLRMVSLTAYTGNLTIRFLGITGTGFESDMAIDDIEIYQPPPVDVGVIAIDNPASGCGLTVTESVTIRVTNFGSAAVDSIPVSYSINGGPAINDTIFPTLLAGATVTFSFATTADLSVLGTYVFDAWTSLLGDAIVLNDSVNGVVVNSQIACCIPTYSNACASDDFIDGVDFAGILNAATGCNGNPDNYIYYAADTGTVTRGSSYPILLTPSTLWVQGFGVWIDFNQDGDFGDAGEFVFFSAAATTPQAGVIAIPVSATIGNTLMRVRCIYDTTPIAVNNCDNQVWGETEDYNIIINSPVTNDVGVVAVTSPTSHCVDGSTDVIIIDVANFSSNTETSIPVSYTVNGGPAVNETFTTTLLPGDTASYTFTTGAVLSPAGTYVIDSWTSLPGDISAANDTSSVTITIYPTPTVNLGADIALCSGSTATLNTSNFGFVSYLWNTGATDSSITTTIAGTFDLMVTDGNGCTNSDTIVVTLNPAMILSMSSTTATCGGSDGTASVSVTGGTTPYTYLWNDGSAQTNSTAAALAAGTYMVTVTDGAACTDSNSVAVSNTGAPIVTITSSVNLLCNGDNNGQATVGATGGTTPYTYSWDDPGTQTNATATGLVAGTYVGTVTDNVGCSSSDNVTITEPAALSLTPSSTNSNCSASDGSATVTVTGGTGTYTYLWDDLGTQTTATAGSIPAGTYNVTVTDANACTDTTSATVSDLGGGTASIASSANASCNGVCDGTATSSIAGGTAPFTYLWDDPASQTNITATGLCATAVNVTITDNVGCISIAGVTLTEPSAIVLTTGSVDATCGNSDGSASVVATGGNGAPYTYLWNDGGAQTTVAAIGLAAGAYVVVVTDAGACSDSATVTVNNTGAPTVTLASSSNVNCNGGNDGSATVNATGGTTPYTYTWDDPGTQTTAMATGLSAGTYVGTVTDNVGCIASAIVIITEPALLAISFASTDVSCPGACDGNATATVTGGTSPYTYVWNDPMLQTNAMSVTLCAGTVTVNITDINGCATSDSVSINTGAGLTLSTSSVDATCGSSDGTATVNATAGTSPYTYMWNDPGTQTNSTAVGLAAGTYTVIVMDAVGCSDSTSVGVNNAGAPTVSIFASTNVSCKGGSNGDATVLATGGTTPYTYLWDDPLAQTVITAVTLSAGTYNVSVTDNVGCLGTASVTITEPTAITITSGSVDPSCFGSCDGTATATSSGGTGTHTYSWDDPGTQTTAMATGLCDGTFNVMVTDSNSCTATAAVTLTQPAGMTLTLSKVDATCGGCTDGTATVSVSGGAPPYTYAWDDPGTQTNSTATGLGAATYNVVVTDATGCVSNGSVVVNDPTTVFTVVITTTNATCVDLCDGSATATATAGSTPYTYLWDDPGTQTTSTATGLCKGIYNVTVSDFTGTEINNTFTIFQPSPIVIMPVITDATCGNADGMVSLTTTGGTPAYAFLWSTGGTGSTETGLTAGTYNVTVTDNQACVQSATFNVGNSDGPVIVLSSTDVTCNGLNDGTASATVTGGTSPYTYLWDDPLNQTVPTAVGLVPGSYSVSVLDATGCTNMSGSSSIIEPLALSLTVTSIDANLGVCNGSATASVIGGNMPYNYLWDDPAAQTTQSATGLCAGTYNVMVTDANACTLSNSIFVGPVTGIQEYDNNAILAVYPNPASEIIHIGLTGFQAEWRLEILDFTGKLVYRENNLNDKQINLNTEALPSGIYLVKAIGGNATIKTVRIVIER